MGIKSNSWNKDSTYFLVYLSKNQYTDVGKLGLSLPFDNKNGAKESSDVVAYKL